MKYICNWCEETFDDAVAAQPRSHDCEDAPASAMRE